MCPADALPCQCRLARALDEEASEGLPIQKLATLHEFPGFDLQQWLQTQPEPNKARHGCAGSRAPEACGALALCEGVGPPADACPT